MKSPFREYFDTNYVPSDAEIQEIRAHLAPHEAELARLESLIQDLAVQRDRIKDHINFHKALVSCPRRIPQDVVEQIFLACLPHYNAIMSATEAPLLLGHICRGWRSIAFSMPRLWDSLHIPIPFVAESEERKIAMVDWLERSAPLPLTISVVFEEDYKTTPAIIDPVLRVSTRWHALHISTIRTDIFFLHLAAVEAPQLVDIEIAFENRFSKDDGPQVLSSNLFRGLQCERVTMTGSNLGELVPITPFTWDNFTHLSLKCTSLSAQWETEGLSPQAAYRLLKGCAQLKSLFFHLTSRDQDDVWVDEPLLLPSLESLIIGDQFYSIDGLVDFVEHLIMPRLVQFRVETRFSTRIIPMSRVGFLQHIAQRSPLISDLGLVLFDFTVTCLIETLGLFPLTKLDLILSTPDKSDLTTLFGILTPNASNPCPALKEFTTRGYQIENDVLVDFLQKQLDYGTLRRLELVLWDLPETIPDVQPFVARGLEISLEYPHVVEGPKHMPWEGINE